MAKTQTSATATFIERVMPEQLPAKATQLLLVIRGLRDKIPESRFAAVEALSYEVECLAVDGRLPWDDAGR